MIIKNARFYILFIFLSFNAFFVFSQDELIIRKIRIIIDEDSYTWEQGDIIPFKVDGAHTEPITIISFLDFKPGDSVSPEKLERKTKMAKYRLIECGYFYSAEVSIVPPRKYPETRTILIKVREGFPYRFGGDSIYGYFGIDNLIGKRKSIKFFAGYNLNGILFRDELFGNSNFIIETGAYYKNAGPGVNSNLKFNLLEMELGLGYRFHPDWIFSINSKTYYKKYPSVDIDYLDLILIPGVSGNIILGNPENPFFIRPVFKSHISFSFLEERKIYTAVLGSLRINCPLGKRQSINMQSSTGLGLSELPERFKFNLYNIPDSSVRSGYDESELLCNKYLLFNLEYRATMAKFFIPPFFNTKLDLFIYSDFGFTSDYEKSFNKHTFKDAYGFGLRIIFDNPVFAYFSFSYGWNNKGEGRFVFTGTKGF